MYIFFVEGENLSEYTKICIPQLLKNPSKVFLTLHNLVPKVPLAL